MLYTQQPTREKKISKRRRMKKLKPKPKLMLWLVSRQLRCGLGKCVIYHMILTIEI